MRTLLRLLIILLTVGWIAPLTLSFKLVYDFIWLVLYPAASGEQLPLTSWYTFQIADELFYLAVLWLAFAVAAWTWHLTGRRTGLR